MKISLEFQLRDLSYKITNHFTHTPNYWLALYRLQKQQLMTITLYKIISNSNYFEFN